MNHKEASALAKSLIHHWDAKDRDSLSIVLEIYKHAPAAKVTDIARALSEKDCLLTRYTRIMRLLGAEGFNTEGTNGD